MTRKKIEKNLFCNKIYIRIVNKITINMAKANKPQKGCVGIGYKGIIMQGKYCLAYCEGSDPAQVGDELVKNYGNGVTFKYVLCENPKTVYEEFKKKNDVTLINDDIFSGAIEATEKSLKEISGISTAHLWPKKSNKTDGDTEPEPPVVVAAPKPPAKVATKKPDAAPPAAATPAKTTKTVAKTVQKVVENEEEAPVVANKPAPKPKGKGK